MLTRQPRTDRPALPNLHLLSPTFIFMLKSPLLFAITALVTLLSWTQTAQANQANQDNLALDFALPSQLSSNSDPVTPAKTAAEAVSGNLSTPVTLESSQTPQSPSSPGSDQPIQTLSRYSDPLPPLNQRPTVPIEQNAAPNLEQKNEQSAALQANNQTGDQKVSHQHTDNIALSFDDHTVETLSLDKIAETTAEKTAEISESKVTALQSLPLDDWIFEGGTNSLVAHTVGKAEGTRSADGQRTQAFYGHRDPGNGVWNIGTFSYQHGAQSPEEADEKQLARLKGQGLQLEAKAKAQGISLSLEAKLNGIDLANQAPLAALDRGGYIEQLAKAYRLQMSGTEAIVWARTYAYLDPDTQQWNAPGLGNNVYSIERDQRRRVDAIAQARNAYANPRFNDLNLDHLNNITLAAGSAPENTSYQLSRSSKLAIESSDQASAPNTLSPSDNVLAPSELSFGLPPLNLSVEETHDTEAVVSMIAPNSNVEGSDFDDAPISTASSTGNDEAIADDNVASVITATSITVTSSDANLAILPVPPLPIPVGSSTPLPADAMSITNLEPKNLENQRAIASNLSISAPLAQAVLGEIERHEPESTEIETPEIEQIGEQPTETEVIASDLEVIQSPQPDPARKRLWYFEDKVGRPAK